MSGHRSGPVRSADARRAILAATARLLVTQGFEGMTIQGIAAEAGVGKQTIYRWWSGKADLLAECLVEGLPFEHDLQVPDTGDVLADVASWLSTMLGADGAVGVRPVLVPLVAAAAGDATLASTLHKVLRGGQPGGLEPRFVAAVERGELPPHTEPGLLTEMLVGVVLVRSLARIEATPGELEAVAAQVLGRAGDDG